MAEAEFTSGPTPKRLHPPKQRSLSLDKEEVVKRILEEYQDDLTDRQDWSEMRLQRYAKMRGWLEPKRWPWPNSSNAHVPMLMSSCQRMEDTLVNAVLTSRPVMTAEAQHDKDKAKEKGVDELLDFQLFMEQDGEEKLQQLAASFTEDGWLFAYIPWVRDRRRVEDVRSWPMSEDGVTKDELESVLKSVVRGLRYEQADDEGFKWKVYGEEDGKQITVRASFQTDERGHLVLISERDMLVYDGPCVIPKSVEDVVFPSRSENPQPPGPSNPGGAPHVILVDCPQFDEIKRLKESKFYDLLTNEELDEIEAAKKGYKGMQAGDGEEHKAQRDALAGQQHGNAESAGESFIRLRYYGPHDLDGDGLAEECVMVLITDGGTNHGWLARARYLSEEVPCFPPRRPFAYEPMIPVQGQMHGISMLELGEALYDTVKIILDQTIDKNTLVNTPWFGYRAASGVRPEVIRMAPGEGYPMANPSQDIYFPQIPNADQALSLNLMTMVQQWAEQQFVLGRLQFGQVPYGKASALRTSGNMQMLLQQGDARPERILRRFFHGIAQIYAHMHELNEVFLPAGKKYRVLTAKPGEDPYRSLDDPTAIKGRFRFDFKASVLNSNRALKGQVMRSIASAIVNPLSIQLGLVGPEQLYNIMIDTIKADGQDPSRYVKEPPQVQVGPPITAEEAVQEIAEGYMPEGIPAEGPTRHLERLQELDKNMDVRMALLTEGGKAILRNYLRKVAGMARQEQQMMAQAQAAQQMNQQMQQEQMPVGMAPTEGTPQVENNELTDEALPTAGGGASGTA